MEARPPSAGYRLQKFVRRHKGQVIAASLVLLAAGGNCGATWGLIEARRQEQEAKRQAQIARGETAEKENARQAEAAAPRRGTLAKLEALAAKEKAVTSEKAEAAQRAQAVVEPRAEASLYINQIYLAQQCWLAGNVQHADRLLAACEKPLRNWEWAYLARTVHPELLTLPGNGQHTSLLAFSRDGNRMLAFTRWGDTGAVVWDLRDGKTALRDQRTQARQSIDPSPPVT